MFLFCLVFAMFCARLFICALWSPAWKGLTSWLSFVVSSVSLSLSHWYPGSGVVLDCIDSWSLHHYLLLETTEKLSCRNIEKQLCCEKTKNCIKVIVKRLYTRGHEELFQMYIEKLEILMSNNKCWNVEPGKCWKCESMVSQKAAPM